MQRKLNILILTQALEDLLAKELGGALTEDDLWTAEVYLSAYPELFKQVLNKKKDLGGWLRSVREAKEGLAAAQQERRRQRRQCGKRI